MSGKLVGACVLVWTGCRNRKDESSMARAFGTATLLKGPRSGGASHRDEDQNSSREHRRVMSRQRQHAGSLVRGTRIFFCSISVHVPFGGISWCHVPLELGQSVLEELMAERRKPR